MLKSPFLGYGGVREVSPCPFSFSIPLTCQKSPPVRQDQSGGGCEIWQYINEFVISCACVALCRAGAFCYLHFETKCPEVRSSSPGCRSPPSPVSVTRSPNTETEVYNDYHQSERFYYWYTQDQFIEVSDEVAEVFLADARYEMAYQRRLSRHKAQYSLDCEDGIEYSACLHEPTPQELLERMELFIRLWNALNSLPEVQGRRVDACVILGKTYSEVAESEGVDESAVRRAVERGLENMKNI